MKVSAKNAIKNSKLMIAIKMKCLSVLAVLLVIVNAHGPGPGGYWPRRRSSNETSMQSRAVDTTVHFEIAEGEPKNTLVGYIPTKQGFRYRFNEPLREFNLDPMTGEIRTNTELDRESLTTDHYDLVILSSQPTYPIEVRIYVLDVNDNSPIFPEPVIAVSFSESNPPGTRLLLDAASDADIGVNSVTDDYQIIGGNDDGKFRLAVTTNPSGDVSYLHLETTGTLDRESKSFYILNISAKDGGIPQRLGYLQVNVTVLDVNDNPPIFDHSDYIVSLNESVTPGTHVLQVMATDSDQGENAKISYYLSEAEHQFTVDADTGHIRTVDKISCPLQDCPEFGSRTHNQCHKSCVFTVFARDHGSPRQDGRTYVTINLLDTNDHDPLIKFQYFPSTSTYATVDENAANGTVLAAISVDDMDEGPNGRTSLEIVAGNEQQHFRLEATTSFYLVRVNSVLDREEINKYNLTVIAVDDGTPQRTTIAHLIILVNDVNDHEPVFEKSEYSVTLSELTPPGSFVASIVAKDEDTGVNAQVLYSFVSGNQKEWFTIVQESGLIVTNSHLDREQQDTILLNISAHDGGPNPKYAFAQLKITLLDENDEAPKFVKTETTIHVKEDVPIGTFITTLTAFDADQGTNGSVTYELKNFQKEFHLDSITGRLTTAGGLDREKVPWYEIKVIASDHGTPVQQSEAKVTLVLDDINDNTPYFYPHTYFTILDEDSDVGTSITHVRAHDPDEGLNSLLKYSIQSGDDTTLFALNSSTGLLTLKAKIDEYPGSSYDLVITTIDGGNRRAKRQANVKIIKQTKMKLIDMSSYEFEVSENEIITIGSLRSDIPLFIVDGDPDDNFRISKGMLTLAKALDREKASSYNLHIVANDGLYYGESKVLVTVLDINDNSPTFNETIAKITIDEDMAVGAVMYNAAAYDADGSDVFYTLQGDIGRIDRHGMITLNRPIREEPGTELKIEVTATDREFTSTMTVTVTVKDINDHTPIFDHTTYETSLIESTPINTRFFALVASDADQGENGRVFFEITEGNAENKFGLFPDGHMYVKNALDREERYYYSLTVTCRDNGQPARSSVVPMIIHVIDDNDNRPMFTNDTFTFRIAENEPVSSFVGKLRATDRDVGRNAELIYVIADAQNDFMVDPRNGFIKTMRSFDRERLAEHGTDTIEFNVVVTDNGEGVRLKDKAKVRVIVTDVNDNSPQFTRTPYKIQVSEGAKIGSQLLKIHASDSDLGVNSFITYSLKELNDNFVIENGVVILTRNLDREMADKYTLTVVAENSKARNKLKNETTVTIEVLDENDNAPEFAQSSTFASVEENKPIGTEIIRFKANDIDAGDNARLHFAITSGNKRDAFTINPTTGIVSLNKNLDYEDTTIYQLNITCSDYGTPPLISSLLFKIYVIDVNDNPPNFPSTAIVRQIKEGIPIGTRIVTVLAEDPDSGVNGKVRYSIVNQEPVNGYFAINSTNGIIHTLRAIDRESIDTFKITVKATDQGTPSLSAKKLVTVIVEDVNDNAPQFTSMNTAIIDSGNNDEMNVVIQVTARDLDSSTNGLVSYEIVNGDMQIFSINRNSGQLTLKKPILSSRGKKFDLMVRATDEAAQNERKSTDSYLTIFQVGDGGELPVFDRQELSGTVYENEPIGTSILKVHASGKNLEYYITNVTRNGRQMERLFDIGQGILSTANIIDREVGDSYDVEVSAVSVTDTITTAKTMIKIQILDRNDCAPRFDTNRLEFNTNEDALVGHIIGKLTATDDDNFGTLTYSILSGDGNLFTVDAVDGSLKLAETLDREQNEEHEFVVQVSDGVHLTNATVVVKVIDTNDNAPVFDKPSYSFEIPENATRGFKVGRVHATDLDIGMNAQITYSVISNWANDVFTLDLTSGAFTLISHLDYEQIPHYILVVQAQDSGNPQLTSTATVYCNVVDLNDNAPLFNQKSFYAEILENAAIQSEVLTVSASDADSGENGRIDYTIIEGDDEQQFEILNTGVVRTVKMLDRETRPAYNLAVMIEDNGMERLSSTTQVTITLKDVNDQRPEFTSMKEVYVVENSPVNTIVTVVMANDRDEGINSRVTYSLSSDSSVPFSLGAIDGVLKVSGALDRELQAQYDIQINARDGGVPTLSSTMNLTVHVVDENDNSPVFDPRQYSAAIAENASIGASVMQVSATDTDEGANGQIRYSIIAGDENQDFSISDDTGVVRVAKNINYERKSRYNLLVKAEDRAGDVSKTETRYDTADLIILITDINDNAPTFYDSPYVTYVMEDIHLPNEGYFLTVNALDADTPPLNNQVRYFLKEGDADLFYVNASTGDISLRTSLDREVIAEHILTIIAMDTGAPPLTGTGTVIVNVMDINDNVPTFEKNDYIIHVQENIEIGSEILKVLATDKDDGLNAVVKYKLSGKYSERFVIDNMGKIRVAALIDREEMSAYELEIIAYDSSPLRSLNSSATLKIIVDDLNDNSPQFERSFYEIYVPNQGKDHFVFGGNAFDPDEDNHLKYSIGGDDADKFYLEQSIVKSKYPGNKDLSLTITATDSGARTATATLKIRFRPAHLFPVFQSNQRKNFVFPENIPSGKSFATISATSPKSGKAGKITYSVANGDAVFITPGGDLMIRDQGLDFETSQVYTIWIAASDSDSPALKSIQSYQINVTDVNDNAPVITAPGLVTVPEGEGPTKLATLVATDADLNENAEITFTLRQDFDSFEIDEGTGELTTVTRLDREEQEFYDLIVLATDNGEPRLTGSATVRVQVLDKNDNPPKFSRLFSVNVTENAEVGSFVVRITSIDLDSAENAQVRYEFGENFENKFKIDPISGNVTVNGPLDREQQEEYILKVVASDGAWRAETPLTITIQDQNDNAPEFEHSYYSFNFPEFQKQSAYVGQVTANDRDKSGPNSVISYSLQKPSDIFTIDPASGELYSKRTLHYKHTEFSPENIYSFVVLATDNGKPPMYSECLVNVNIIDANNNPPIFEKRSYLSPVPMGAKYGQRVLQVIAKDDADFGVNAEISYQIVGGNGSNYFVINHNDGWIATSRPVSSSVGEKFIVLVKAFDRGIPPQYDEVSVTIIVSGENKYSPVFTALSYQVIVPENEPIGSTILNVMATDADDGLNGEVVYAISAGNERGEFTVVEGNIIIAQALDFETIPEYHLNVTASDLGYVPRKTVAMLKVTLTDINDNPPVLPKAEYHAYLVENSPVNSTVFQVRASDRDSPKNALIEYSLPKKDLFWIEASTGLIRSKVVFDFEEENLYELQVVARNPQSTMNGTAKVIVHITGVNEYVPKFVQSVFHFDVSESTEIGSTIGMIRATDSDHGADGKIYYLLVGSSQEKGFSVNKDTGEIKISRPLDRETQSRVVLTVMAKNFGSIRGNDTDEAQVIISIQDGNDPPVFSQSIYRASVSEDVPKGHELIQVSASDTDLKPQNNQFNFRILDGNVNETFHIDPIGIIRTRKLLDRETIPQYTLTVGAIDTGLPPATGTATIEIDVEDVNDNGPMFEPENLIGYVSENEPPNTSIMTLTAYDIDIGGEPFTYRLIGGGQKHLVSLEPSGLLRTVRTIDREQIPELNLIVEVEDNGGMKSQHKLVVHVEDQNDSPSIPRNVKVVAMIYKGHILPESVFADVRPNDPDTTGDYRCKIDSKAFKIKTACFLSTTETTQLRNYSLSVTGNDGKHPSVLSTVEISLSKFNEKHVENAIIVRIEDMSADNFLSSYFQSFVTFVKVISGRLTIFAIKEESGGVEIFLSIEDKTPGNVIENLLKRYDQLVEQLHKKIIIGYSKCSKSVCENEGQCRSRIVVQHNEFVTVASESLIFTAPRADSQYECSCSESFTGDRCEKRLNPCAPNPCQAGGQCRRQGYDFQCYCPPDRDGRFCEIKRSNLCLQNPCQNGGSCHADGAAFFCLCRPGYRGSRCEFLIDTCRPNPCNNGGKCTPLKPGYKCTCTTGYFGQNCDQSTYAFNELSYLEFPELDATTNDISVVFSTSKPNALLAYNFGTAIGGRSDFVALELIAGKAVFSFGGAQTAITSLVVGRNGETFADGSWHKATATRNGKVVSLSVAACKDDEDSCDECRIGDEKCYTDDIGPASTLNFNKNGLFIGGLPSADPILERPGQIHTDDFIGCIQSISINGRFLDVSNAVRADNVAEKCSRPSTGICQASVCGEFTCIDRWNTAMCECGAGVLAPNCQNAVQPVSLNDGSFLEVKISKKHKRMQLLSSIYTQHAWTHRLKKRSTNSSTKWHLDREMAPKMLSLTFKTVKSNGLLFFSATSKHFTLVELKEGQLVYKSNQGGNVQRFSEPTNWANGVWHTVRMRLDQSSFELWVDQVKVKEANEQDVHDFLDPYLTNMFIGNVVPGMSPEGEKIVNFEGCLVNFTINNEVQPFDGAGSVFNKVVQHGKVFRGCFDLVKLGSAQVTDPLSVGLSLVIGFVVILLIATAVSFVFFKFHKQQKGKAPPPVHKQGPALLPSDMSRGMHVGDVMSSDYRSTHHYVGQEIISKKYKDREVTSLDTQRSQRPDIIEREVVKTASLQRDEHHPPLPPHDHTSNLELEEFSEYHDLENTNSIAPYHYKGYRDGAVRKFKASPLSLPGYHHKHQQQHRHSPHHGPFRVPPQQSSAPNTSRPHQSTPLARLSPSSELSSQHPRILTLHDISGKPLQSALLATTSSSGGVGKDVLHSNSERSLNSPVMSQLSAESSSASRKNPKQADMLTAEELERLNVRPRTSSLVSTLDAVSCSSERVGVGVPPHHMHHSQNVDASSTSSDESGNDSFTCSEIEYDNNSINGDSSSKYKSDSMPANDCGAEAASNKPESTYDGFDSSFRGSLSTLVASDDDLSSHIGNIYRQPAGAPTQPMGWEYLLNWGPNFESLVGVFKDIAELPDTANGVNPLRMPNTLQKPSEEYV